MNEAQAAIRSRLDAMPTARSPVVGYIYIGIVPVGQYGWLHGRIGYLQADGSLICPETGERFTPTRLIRRR